MLIEKIVKIFYNILENSIMGQKFLQDENIREGDCKWNYQKNKNY